MAVPLNTKTYDHRESTPAWVSWLFGLASLGILTELVRISGYLGAFQFSYSPYAILPLLGLTSDCILIVLVARLRTQTRSTIWFLGFLVSMVVNSGGELLQRLSTTPAAANVWSTVSTIGGVCFVATFCFFALVHLRYEKILANVYFVFFMAISTFFFLYLISGSSTIIMGQVQSLVLKPWGYEAPNGPYYFFYVIWYVVLLGGCLVLFAREFRRARDHAGHMRHGLFMLAVALPLLVGGIFIGGVLPLLGYEPLPVTAALTAFSGILVAYSIFRYRLFVFNPASIATNVLETMREAVIVLNTDYSIAYANRQAEDLLGSASNSLIGQDLVRYFRGNEEKLQQRLLVPLRTQSHAEIGETEISLVRGKRVPVSVSAAQFIGDLYTVDGYVVVMTDISEVEAKVVERTHDVKEGQARLTASINSLDIGYVMLDQNLEIVIANQTTRQILKTHKDISFSQLEELIHGELDLKAEVTLCMQKATSRRQNAVPLSDGRFVNILISPIVHDGAIIGTVLLLEDVTEARIIERSKDEFFSIASHEMRTPLIAIVGYASMIMEKYPENTANASLTHMVDNIFRSGQRLMKIVNDFLIMSSLEQKFAKYRIEDFQLRLLLEEVAQELSPLALAKNLPLTTSCPPHYSARADRDRVRQVLINLIGNAIQNTETGEVRVEVISKKGMLEISVSDTGRGIAPANQPLLFRKFQQAGSSLLTREISQGTGLGLYISKLLVEQMGGTIGLHHSLEGKGSVFSFTIPSSRSPRL